MANAKPIAGVSGMDSFNQLFQQANAEGITIVGPSGDSGATDCDYQTVTATQGLAVDFPGSSPFVTSAGGTMFNEGSATGATSYWSGEQRCQLRFGHSLYPRGGLERVQQHQRPRRGRRRSQRLLLQAFVADRCTAFPMTTPAMFPTSLSTPPPVTMAISSACRDRVPMAIAMRPGI